MLELMKDILIYVVYGVLCFVVASTIIMLIMFSDLDKKIQYIYGTCKCSVVRPDGGCK